MIRQNDELQLAGRTARRKDEENCIKLFASPPSTSAFDSLPPSDPSDENCSNIICGHLQVLGQAAQMHRTPANVSHRTEGTKKETEWGSNRTSTCKVLRKLQQFLRMFHHLWRCFVGKSLSSVHFWLGQSFAPELHVSSCMNI